jgi:peptidoglycan/xylan/chitin deacetylase (PgdA/CDA1 family)
LNGNGQGAWDDASGGRSAEIKKQLVRSSFDALRWVEQRVDRSLGVPLAGHGRREAISSVDTSEPVVALTFDDGPHPEQTPRLLDLLAERGIRATFYLIGANAQAHPEIVERTLAEGHELGNHTWSHRFLTTQRSRSILEEVGSAHSVINDITGAPPATLRPPYGAVTPGLSGWMNSRFGYETVLWSVDAADWEGPDSDTITERLVSGARNGSIILVHDPVPAVVEAMPETLDRLLDRGFRFVTVGELLAMR